jgi:hypothetical protein
MKGQGLAMKVQWDDRISEFEGFNDLPSPGLPAGERLIRGFLLAGFLIVLVIEVWFVLQLFRLL